MEPYVRSEYFAVLSTRARLAPYALPQSASSRRARPQEVL